MNHALKQIDSPGGGHRHPPSLIELLPRLAFHCAQIELQIIDLRAASTVMLTLKAAIDVIIRQAGCPAIETSSVSAGTQAGKPAIKRLRNLACRLKSGPP